ncbi:hypothetical protein R1flu_014750 [Riccia fluitans]|uniref:Peptidase A1 domain-containing protein n=1 Tax=Riccia fluitans TaxID=41844 RepID=A0ABD1YH05_9MARC
MVGEIGLHSQPAASSNECVTVEEKEEGFARRGSGSVFRSSSMKRVGGPATTSFCAVLWFRTPSLSYFEEQWDEGEEWVHVHRLYAKHIVTMAESEVISDDYQPPDGLVERDFQRRNLWERVVQKDTVNGSSLFPIRGNIYPDGLYFMQLNVGNPPKPYYMDIDTGSDLTWLQCNAPCTSCPQTPHPLYNPRGAHLVDCKQPICSQLQGGGSFGCSGGGGQCDYEIQYGDSSSTTGVLLEDMVSLVLTNGSVAHVKAVFGCSYDQHGTFAKSPSKTDGLLGLSRATVAFPAQLAAQGIVKNVVAHCLAGGSQGGGYLFFGDDLVPAWGMTWTPVIRKPYRDNYYVSVQKIQYGFSGLDLDPSVLRENEFIFDSGTSYTYLSPEIYSAFVSAVREGLEGSGLEQDTSDKTLPLCWRGKAPFRTLSEASSYFQPITLNFGTSWLLASKFMIVVPQAYLVLTPQGNVCMGIMNSSETGSEGINIIGDISLRGHLIVYDNVENRVGWMPSDCRKPPKSRAFTLI